MKRNETGLPARGDDFHDRHDERRRIWDKIPTDNLLMLAPRRIGKTSILHRLMTEADARGYEAVFADVSGIESELGFVERLYRAFAENENSREFWKTLLTGKLKKVFGTVKSFTVAELEVVFRDRQLTEWRELGEALLDAIAGTERKWLVILDEVPVFVMTLLRQEPEGTRARAFLEWFRRLRQGSSRAVERTRWIVAGSIGLGTVTGRYNMGDTIADLHIFEIDAFTREAAEDLLRELASSYRMTLARDVIDRMIEQIGWLLPYHVQLLFSALRELPNVDKSPPTVLDVDEAHEKLLSPSRRPQFDFWVQRLGQVLGPPLDEGAKRMLNAAAKDPAGASRATLKRALSGGVSTTKANGQDFDWLLNVLIPDGYLVEESGRFRFRSSLLREFWLRRFPAK